MYLEGLLLFVCLLVFLFVMCARNSVDRSEIIEIFTRGSSKSLLSSQKRELADQKRLTVVQKVYT